MSTPGAARSTRSDGWRSRRPVLRIVAATVSTWGRFAGSRDRRARLALVPRRGDDERPVRRASTIAASSRRVVGTPKLMLITPRPGDRARSAGDHVGASRHAVRRTSGDRLRVDAEEADAVLGRRGHRRDGGAVVVAESARLWGPRKVVFGRPANSGGSGRCRVDDGDRLAGPRRDAADRRRRRPPVLGRQERVDGRGRARRPIGLDAATPAASASQRAERAASGRARCGSRRCEERDERPRSGERPRSTDERPRRAAGPRAKPASQAAARRRRGERDEGSDEREQAEASRPLPARASSTLRRRHG